jgi:AraC-like DNA-binding protein
MLILREMPDLPPRPLTPANAVFRQQFYARWGKEHAIVCGTAQRAEYATHRQTLSIKTCQRGSEQYFIGRHQLAVDDDTYLILNEGRVYGSLMDSEKGAESFCIFFKPGFAAEAHAAMHASSQQMADHGVQALSLPAEFAEHLHVHDELVSPLIGHLHRAVFAGMNDEFWYEEQFVRLVNRMLLADRQLRAAELSIAAARASTRRELARRVMLAADYIHTCYAQPLSLDAVANKAMLSKFHLLRLFKQLHGVTPHDFLQAKRGQAARRLLQYSSLPVGQVALAVGFADRTTLFRQLRKQFGIAPTQLRDCTSAVGTVLQ